MHIHVSIPMPFIISIEDVGWWSGEDGSAVHQPYRTGMPRGHVTEDYKALAALGQNMDMRVLGGFVLGEWDRNGLVQRLPSAAWKTPPRPLSRQEIQQREKAADIIRREAEYIEIGLHGLVHEFWGNGCMERTEFHTPDCRMRSPGQIADHLEAFFEILGQYQLDQTVRTFIPPALKHSFGQGDRGFQAILNRFGIRYVSLVMDRARFYSPPQTPTLAWENNVLLVERGEADVEWNIAAARPVFEFDRPVMALHWANILHPDPNKNLKVIRNWVDYLQEGCKNRGMLIARDSRSCFTQYLHYCLSDIKTGKNHVIIDMSWMRQFPKPLLADSIFLKIDTGPGTRPNISGTRTIPSQRAAEKDFIKLALPDQNRIIIQAADA